MMNPTYSGFWSRVGAALIDTIILLIVTEPLLLLAYGKGYWSSDKLILGPLDFFLTWLLPPVYFIGMWHVYQATLGKKMMKQMVVDADTLQPATPGQLIGRYLAYIPSILCFGLGILWVALDKKKQGWHDKLAGTVVIEKVGA
jgi:uncharacterized RDD family membrane protein YckC